MTIDFGKLDFTAELKVSYEAALTVAKHEKVFLDGEIMKENGVKMTLTFGDNKQAKDIEKVSFPRQTVARRVVEFSENVALQLKENIQKCKYFSLILNDSADVSDKTGAMV